MLAWQVKVPTLTSTDGTRPRSLAGGINVPMSAHSHQRSQSSNAGYLRSRGCQTKWKTVSVKRRPSQTPKNSSLVWWAPRTRTENPLIKSKIVSCAVRAAWIPGVLGRWVMRCAANQRVYEDTLTGSQFTPLVQLPQVRVRAVAVVKHTASLHPAAVVVCTDSIAPCESPDSHTRLYPVAR